MQIPTLHAYLFDWDGVFNPGVKSDNLPSTFSEPDAMGVNMLRFSHWLKYGKMPFTGIISGERNPVALHLAQREHFNEVYFRFSHKTEAMEQITHKYGIKPSEAAFVFDDILDLSLAAQVGLRILVGRPGNPLFRNYVAAKKLTDYITTESGASYAVREACEWIIGLNGNYFETLDERVAYSDKYKQYLAERNAIETSVFINDKK